MLTQNLGRKALVIATLTMALTGFASQASAQYEGDTGGAIGGIGSGSHTGDGEIQNGSDQISYDEAEAAVRALYRAVLFREGEDEGVQFWLEVVLTHPGKEGLIHAAYGFATSPEFRNQILPVHSDQEILENIYAVFFNRPIDPLGAATWGSFFEQGRHAEALHSIVGSDEFAAHFLRD